jgi:hypothetical protein
MSVISGIFQSEAASDAADTSAQASRDAAAQQYKMFQEQQAAMEPWRASGANALNRLNALMGLPTVSPTAIPGVTPGTTAPGGQPIAASGNPVINALINAIIRQRGGGATPSASGSNVLMRRPVREGDPWQADTAPQSWQDLMDPGYAFRKQEGINALAAAGAASGNYGSGNMGVALQDFGQNLASQEFQNVYNRLAGMSGTGQVQSQAIGGMGMNTGNVMANYLNQAGQNIAQGQIASSNALTGGARDLEKGSLRTICSSHQESPN